MVSTFTNLERLFNITYQSTLLHLTWRILISVTRLINDSGMSNLYFLFNWLLFVSTLFNLRKAKSKIFFSLSDSQQVAFEKGSIPRFPSPPSLVRALNPVRSRKIQVLCCILRCSAIVFPKPTKLLFQLKFLVCEWKPTIRISLPMGARFVIFLKAVLTSCL